MTLAYAFALFALSLLAALRAPEYHLWMASIIATEWGHVLAILSLLPLMRGWKGGRLAAALLSISAFLFLTPLIRSWSVAAVLPHDLEAAFGPSNVSSTPLSLKNLLTGVPIGPTRQTTFIYARSCGESLSLELYRPPQDAKPLPLVVVIHGGSWQSGSRLEFGELSRYLAARGYAVASVDYGLAPRSIFPGPVEDVRDALVFLRRHAAEYSLDASQIVLLGRSAGGQIALAAAHDPEPLPGLKGVIVFYGPNDMPFSWSFPGPKRIIDTRKLLRQYLGGSPVEQPERLIAASPLLRAGAYSPPTLMIHGERDELVMPIHEDRLSKKLKMAGVPHYYLSMPWATHGCDYNFSGPCGQLSTYAVERFLGFAFR